LSSPHGKVSVRTGAEYASVEFLISACPLPDSNANRRNHQKASRCALDVLPTTRIERSPTSCRRNEKTTGIPHKAIDIIDNRAACIVTPRVGSTKLGRRAKWAKSVFGFSTLSA
jgi:hypothetical protein